MFMCDSQPANHACVALSCTIPMLGMMLGCAAKDRQTCLDVGRLAVGEAQRTPPPCGFATVRYPVIRRYLVCACGVVRAYPLLWLCAVECECGAAATRWCVRVQEVLVHDAFTSHEITSVPSLERDP